MFRELYLSLRILRNNAGFSLTAILLLSLGIGVTAAMFNVVDSLLIHTLPFQNASRMVSLRTHWTGTMSGSGPLSYPDYLDLRAQSPVFEKLAVYRSEDFTLAVDRSTIHVRGAVVSADLFPLLSVRPYLGRWFSSEEDTLAGTQSSFPMVLNYALWETSFLSDPHVVGSSKVLDGTQFTIVGVMPKDFIFPMLPDVGLWVTMAVDLAPSSSSAGLSSRRSSHYLDAIGLLRTDTTLQAARSSTDLVMSRLAGQYPDTNRDKGILLKSERDEVIGNRRSQLLMLSTAVICVLLISCINVAMLLLARGANQEKELAVRIALGASFGRILQQVLAQCLWLVVIGALLGVALATGLSGYFLRTSREMVSTLPEFHPNWEVWLFVLAASAISVLLCGCVPALVVARVKDLATILKGVRTAAGSNRTRRLRNGLIMGQTVLAMVLLVQAGLLVRSMIALTHVDTGFTPQNVLTFQLQFPAATYSGSERNLMVQNIVEKVEKLPGIRNATVTRSLPLSGEDMAVGFRVPNNPAPGNRVPIADLSAVGPGYFDTLGIQIVHGRQIDLRDEQADARPVAIINETLAKRFFGNNDPIGRTIQPLIRTGEGRPPERQIIGVAHDVKDRSLKGEDLNQIYLPYNQLSTTTAAIAVRSARELVALTDEMRYQVRTVDPTAAVYNLLPMSHYVAVATAEPRLNTGVVFMFAIIALILDMIGLHSVISYSVTERKREFGIRMALGAHTSSIIRMVLKEGAKLTVPSVLAGFAASAVVAKLVSSLLYSIRPFDPLTFGIVTFGILIISLVATYLPARKAIKVDPAVTLRME